MREKGARGNKMHQGSSDQETEAVSDVRLELSANRTSLRKIVQKGRPLVTQSSASPENCKKSAIETN